MSLEIDVLIETYGILYQYIPTKDRQEAADHLMSSLVDLISDEELREIGDVDQYMRRSYKEYISDDDDSDYDEDGE